MPSNLVKLLGGYARMGHISSTCSSMLDAAAGFVVRRMAAGHLNAVTKLSDLSQLLQAYATLGHQTVVMPELLTAASNQVSLYILIRAACPSTSVVWARVTCSILTHVPAMACCGWCCCFEWQTTTKPASCQHLQWSLKALANHIDMQCWMHARRMFHLLHLTCERPVDARTMQ